MQQIFQVIISMVTGIANAELAGKKFAAAMKEQGALLVEMFAKGQMFQAEVKDQILSAYEKQLAQEALMMKIKAVVLAIVVIIITVFLMVWFTKKDSNA